jgi:hypothetical protein
MIFAALVPVVVRDFPALLRLAALTSLRFFPSGAASSRTVFSGFDVGFF